MGVHRLARCVAVLVSALALAGVARAANPVAMENARSGDRTWMGALAAHVTFSHPPVDGYADATSVRPGGTIAFHVNLAEPGRYRLELVRLGWYGGRGGRRLVCLVGSRLDPSCRADEPGVQQPAPPPPNPLTGELAAGWGVTDMLRVPDHWVTGYYLAIIQVTAGTAAGNTGFVPFIVQAPAGDRSRVLVVVPTDTWQAYNTWGGESLYTTPEAVKVSFDRPYQHRHLFRWEYPLLRFLERNRYDLSYATDDDVARDPEILEHHRLDMVAGHSEYWTRTERDAFQTARRAGVNLAFMGANDGYWQVRYEDGYRTMVSYKSPSDPVRSWALKTIQFRDLRPPRPECQLLGEQYGQNDAEDGHYFSYQVTRAGARDSWVAGTGLAAGSALSGLVGFEFDSVVPTCRVPPVTDLFHWGGGSEAADTVRYRACSGSEVFDAGSLFFAWGLDSFRDPEYSPPLWPPPPRAVPALGRFMRRAIGDMLIRHPPFQVAGAVKVLRSGLRIAPGVLRSKLRIAPGVPGAAVSVRAVAYDSLLSPRAIGRIAFRTADTWRLRIPPSAAALEVTVTVRTGLVRDSAQYLLIPGAGGGVRAVTGVSCDGSHARVLTPAFGGERQSPLRVQFALRGPVRVTVGHRLFGVRRSRGTLEIPASAAACGPVSVVVAGRGHRKFRLAAVDVCEAVSARASRAPARPQLFGVAGSPFATGRRPEAVAFSPDGRLLASADSIDNAVSVFAVAPSGSLSRLQGSPLTTGSLPSAVAFSPDGALLAVTNYGGDTVSVYAVAATGTMSQVPGSPFATGGYSTSVGFSPDGHLVATADSEDFTTSVFTVAPGGRVSRANGSPFATGAQPQSLAFAPSGRLLAVANYVGETVSLFTVGPDGELTPAPGSPLPIGAHPESLAFNPASGVLAVAATDGSRTFVHQFSAAPGAGPRELPGSPYRVTGDNYAQSLAFSPDGQLLADANANVGTVSVFEVGPAAGLSEIAGSPYPIGRSAWPLSVSFGRSGRLLATANFGGNSISMFTTSPPTVAAIRVSLGQGLAPHGPRAPIRALLKYSGYPITVTALRAGRLTIGWYARGGVRVAGATTGFYGAGTKTIKIGLTAAGRRLLAKAGRMKLRVRASFDPYGAGGAVTTERRITLRRRAQG